MLLKSPQLDSILTPRSVNPTDVVDYVNSHIDKNSCEHLTVDISFMNVIDACYVTTLCATKHFTKYPNGKINWRVSSKSIKELNKDLDLGNNHYIL